MTDERRWRFQRGRTTAIASVRAVFERSPRTELRPADVARALSGTQTGTVRQSLRRLVTAGVLRRDQWGRYRMPPKPQDGVACSCCPQIAAGTA